MACVVLFILLSCLTTHYWDKTFAQLKSLLGALMLCYIISVLAIDPKKRPYLYSIWIAYYIGMLMYIPQMDIFEGFDYTKDRLNDSQLNANTIAYHTFYLTFVFYMLGELVQDVKKNKIFKVLFFLAIPLSFGVALITGSRQVLMIQVPLILFLLLLRYYKNIGNAKTLIICILASIGLGIFIEAKGKEIFENSVLANRYEKNIEEDSRTKLLKDAIKVGSQSPILGVGPGNYIQFSYNKHFSHCTYTELFANCGIFALFFYVYMLWVFLKKQYLYYKETRDKLFIAFLIFGLIFVLDNFLYVFYYMLWLMPFFFLVGSHSDSYYKELMLTTIKEQ